MDSSNGVISMQIKIETEANVADTNDNLKYTQRSRDRENHDA